MRPDGLVHTDGPAILAGNGAPSLQVPDGFDIFSAQYSRDGDDLVIAAEGGPPLTVIDYFTVDSPPALEMPNGAMLTGDVVDLLAGPRAPGQYAQADAPEGSEAIGRVETMTGSCTATRVSGETVELAQGDPVFQGDVIETAGDSTLGIRLEDGTLASMSAQSRLVLNEFVFETGGSDNWMVVNLVEGAFAFLTGAIAPSGGMEITTPVAVMAIRGTMPVAFVSGVDGATQFFAASDQDYELLHLTTREVLAVISSEAGFSLSSPDAPLESIALDPQTRDEIDGLLDVLNDAAAELGLLGIQDGSGFRTYSAFGDIDGNLASLIQFLLLLDEALAEEAVLEVEDPNQFLMAEAVLTASPDQAATDEMSPIIVDVLDNDIHPDGDELTVVFADVPNGQGSVTIMDGQYLVFDPGTDFDHLALGETTDVVITYTVADPTGAIASTTVTVTLTGVNQAPVIAAVGETSLDEQTDTQPLDATIAVTFTDVDLNNVGHGAAVVDVAVNGEIEGLTLDSAALMALVSPGPVTKNAGDENGSVDVDFSAPSGVFDYLADGEVVTLTYTLEIDDGDGGTTQQSFVVTITGTNDAPVIDETLSDVAATVVEDGFDAGGNPVGDPDASGQIAASDVDNGGRAYSVAQANGSFGVFAINAAGEWTYNLDDAAADNLALGETRTEVFEVTVTDGFGATDEVLVTITIEGSNDAPRVQNVSLLATEDGAVVPENFVGGDRDSDDNAASLTYNVTQPGEGSVINNGDGTFGFDPGSDFQDLGAGDTREVTFTYTATDSHGLVSAPATVTVTVTGTNDVPVVSGVSTGAVIEDAHAATLTTGGALTIADPDAGESSFEPQTSVAGTYGSFTLLADGTWSYSADNSQSAIQELGAGDTLTDSFTAVSSDGTGSQQVTVTIHGTNDVPQVTALTGSVGEDGPSFSKNLLGGTSDVDGGTLSVQEVDGSVTTEDGRVLTAGIHYTVTGKTFALTADGFALFNGLAEGEADSFVVNFEVFDGTDATPNTLVVTVNGDNDLPVVTALSGNVGEDGPSFSQDLLSGASDVDASDILTVQNVEGSVITVDGRELTAGTHYTVTGSTFALTAAGFALFDDLASGESDSFIVDFQVFDGTDATVNTLTVTVNGDNSSPEVTALLGSVGEDGPSFSQDLLSGASDVDASDTLTVQNVDGSVTTSDGRVLTAGTHYTVTGSTFALTAAGFALFNDLAEGEADSFTVDFEVFDGTNGTANTLTVTVNGDNDLPVVTALSGNVGEDGPSFSQDLLSGASDVDASDVLTVQNVEGSVTTSDGRELTAGTHYTVTGSTFALTAAGLALFDDLAEGEADSFTVGFQVFDGNDVTANTLTVTVNGDNDGPVVTALSGSVGEDGPSFSQDLLSGASDVDASDTLMVRNVEGSVTTSDGRELSLGTHYTVSGSTFALTAAGFALFNDLAEGEADSFTVDFQVFDGTNGTANTLTVTVNGDNDLPVVTALSGSVGEDGPSFSQDLLSGASDVDASDTLTVQNVEGSVTTSDGRELTAGTHYTVTGSTFALTAAGFALFDNLADGEADSFDVGFHVFDGSDATANTLTVTVNGDNDAPVVKVGEGDSVKADLIANDATPTTFLLTAEPGNPGYIDGEMATVTFSITRGDGSVEVITLQVEMGSSHALTLPKLVAAINAEDIGLTAQYKESDDPLTARQFTLAVSGGELDADDLTVTFHNPLAEWTYTFLDEVHKPGADAAGLSAEGTLSVSDVDAGDVLTASVGDELTIGGSDDIILPEGLASDLQGMMSVGSVDAAGKITWTFDSGEEAFGFLEPNQVLTLTYTIEVEDSAGAADSQDVTITIFGAGSDPQPSVSSSESEFSSALMAGMETLDDDTDAGVFVLTETDLTLDDVIIDYKEGDVIDLTQLGFELATGDLNADGAAEYVAYDSDERVLSVDMDGAGNEADFEAIAELVSPPESIFVRLAAGDTTADIEIA